MAGSGGYTHFTYLGQTFPLSDTIVAALGDADGDGALDAFVANANLFGDQARANRVW